MNKQEENITYLHQTLFNFKKETNCKEMHSLNLQEK